MSFSGSFRSLSAVVLVLLLGAVAWAQTGTSAVRGTVLDPQNRVIANATIMLTNVANNAIRNQKTGPSGNFSFDQLPPGVYRVEAEAPGFKKTVLDRVQALIDHPTDLNIQLAIGGGTESITVEAESSSVQVNTQDATLGNNFVSQQITQLPLESRNVLSLLTLQPGVTKEGYVAGARSDQSNITLDGVDINDAQSNSVAPQTNPILGTPQGGGPVLRLNAEAVDQFRVSTVGQTAAAGRSSGAQIALVTKSGTNNFHGSLFEFHRNTIFTANDWFSNHNDIPRAALIRNTFGGAIGGPIKKNKAFFFYSYEGRRDASQTPVDARLVPLPSLAQGIVKFRDNTGAVRQLTAGDIATIFPDTGGVNPASFTGLAVGAKYTANSTQVGDGLNTGGFVFNAAQPVKLNSHVAKFDYNLSQKQQLSGRLNVIYDHDSSTAAVAAPRFPDTKAPTLWSHPWGLAANHTWSLRDNLVNSFRYGLTRQSFTQIGDQNTNVSYFRLVFQPVALSTNTDRTTWVHNFIDDVTWVKGTHTLQFGANIDVVRNLLNSFSSSFDTATTNPSGYKTNLITSAVNQYLTETAGVTICASSACGGTAKSSVENAVTALLGRFTQYTANFNFQHNGSIMPGGVPTARDFRTQGYEGYAQDVWKLRPSITLTYGLRYSLWRPVYEAKGFEVQPEIPLGELFKRRVAAMNSGTNYTQDIILNLSGPVNGGKPMYDWNKTNFLPRVAVAWSPRTSSGGLMSRLLGKSGDSVIRGGFAMLDDYFGQQLAQFFDQRNTLGFNSSTVIPVNTYNVGCGHYVSAGFYAPNGLTCTSNPGPLFTQFFGQPIRTLPGIQTPATLTFPQQKSEQDFPTRIETSLDSQLTQPKNYSANLTYERQMPKNGLLQLSYIGRFGRNLLAERDIATPINLRDPKSGQDYYTAATILEKARQAGVSLSQVGVAGGQVAPQPFFENFFPSLVGGGNASATQAWYADALVNTNDWTTTALDFEQSSTLGAHAFYQPQYGALNTWTTIGYSNYNALAASYRQRLKTLTVDFNYTYSHSLDDASGLQNELSFASSSLILNPFRPQDNYASSDFDMRHMINVSSIWELPFGHGRLFGDHTSGFLNAVFGGWQLSNIFRWNSGIPLGAPFDAAQWSTNWENQSQVNLVAPLPVSGCSTRLVDTPQFFGNCMAQAQAAFRSSYPGETGLRNYFRMPGFVNLDMGLNKTWDLPFIREGHQLQFRWETFNVTNTQEFGNLNFSRNGWGLPAADGAINGGLATEFSNFAGPMQGTSRVMQFGLRYSF